MEDFAATVFAKTQERLEKDLQEEWKQKGTKSIPKFMEPLIDPNIPKDTIFPGAFEKLIKEKYDLLLAPFGVRLLVAGINE